MPLPSLWISEHGARAWSVRRAACWGAIVGALAAVFKTLGPLHQPPAVMAAAAAKLAAPLPEIAAATLGFALLCAGACALRNLIARRLIWPEMR